MGGLNSEVSDSTAAILIESAFFDPMAIARTSRRLGLRSEASYRFERGIDRQGQVRAVIRAAALIGKIAGGREAGAITDVEPIPAPTREIDFDLNAMASMLGVEIPAVEVKRRLQRAGRHGRIGREGSLKVAPPSFRPDLNEQADLVEEVARLNGLEDVPAVLAPRAAAPRAENPERAFTRRAREVLIGCGLTEIKDHRFYRAGRQCEIHRPRRRRAGEGDQSAFGRVVRATAQPDAGAARGAALQPEPASRRVSRLRDRQSFRRQRRSAGRSTASCGDQPRRFRAGRGRRQAASRRVSSRSREHFETLFQSIGISERVEFERAPVTAFLHPGRAARVKLDGRILGCLGELHPREAMRLELTQPCALCELDIAQLIAYVLPRQSIEPPPRFPAVRRDLALVLDREFPVGSVVRTVAQLSRRCLRVWSCLTSTRGSRSRAGRRASLWP